MVRVVIPVLNEELSIGRVLGDIPRWITEVVVVDNGSTDGTAGIAASLGAKVVSEKRRGYGAACLRGIAALAPDTDVVVFMDGDYSDYPEEIAGLIDPILEGRADLVIGSRTSGLSEKGSLPPVAIFGNWLSTSLIRFGWGFQYSDLGPFRAIRFQSLPGLNMQDLNFGWTVEMQIKALNRGLKVTEIPVSYRKRIGRSKISGTVMGSLRAGYKILFTIGREWLLRESPGLRAQVKNASAISCPPNPRRPSDE